MDNVEFEGDRTYVSPVVASGEKKGSFLTKLAMKMGAKSYAQAQIYLLGVAIVVVIITIIVISTQFGGGGGGDLPSGIIDPAEFPI
ncbi:MAG: hypothetical protein A3G52_02955 [Candidatus Taylorbacteria bacterium RIFCSPLOWO2_12_FULL_43_20]|uniref:Uncharacterized protein n=1 Tax=Candidatus Taylorbacteria bacterium RIFCSPLOWO2_12_FULL_43_20 TaxID=1802332 RepID=A0A1G2P331_9BACT|nr:MAG: hypothetical protein A2825_03895 [Candidatus Taylorbacteria bacterium RIFCSPHIGHO2_01_FULL_43_120]OHA22088.1 MAG: hypothetical protein A3B98_04280 [Candidatus Taylorbacteria bacterium RIFCSPHIGHO2_02_FULL_43_55]OHA28168.1 MAG: hypothetical protein A3E92_02095 [Candidatus Taylorbacteria bacterium RIFCSPHIGHO2_12_FULL_42_34]OHA31060.1 MAG: hypothetical protein A3B09_04220 [Candidatus Taylorbacteria bacterium RIFCSPLOWO2_01_FULL_43_83]OHA39704.1 MAG: hypothetical protein A3H58_04580 [Candi